MVVSYDNVLIWAYAHIYPIIQSPQLYVNDINISLENYPELICKPPPLDLMLASRYTSDYGSPSGGGIVPTEPRLSSSQAVSTGER
jgi:hypothetical protein